MVRAAMSIIPTIITTCRDIAAHHSLGNDQFNPLSADRNEPIYLSTAQIGRDTAAAISRLPIAAR